MVLKRKIEKELQMLLITWKNIHVFGLQHGLLIWTQHPEWLLSLTHNCVTKLIYFRHLIVVQVNCNHLLNWQNIDLVSYRIICAVWNTNGYGDTIATINLTIDSVCTKERKILHEIGHGLGGKGRVFKNQKKKMNLNPNPNPNLNPET